VLLHFLITDLCNELKRPCKIMDESQRPSSEEESLDSEAERCAELERTVQERLSLRGHSVGLEQREPWQAPLRSPHNSPFLPPSATPAGRGQYRASELADLRPASNVRGAVSFGPFGIHLPGSFLPDAAFLEQANEPPQQLAAGFKPWDSGPPVPSPAASFGPGSNVPADPSLYSFSPQQLQMFQGLQQLGGQRPQGHMGPGISMQNSGFGGGMEAASQSAGDEAHARTAGKRRQKETVKRAPLHAEAGPGEEGFQGDTSKVQPGRKSRVTKPGAGRGRKMTRPWTDDEIARLLKLVKDYRKLLLDVSNRAKKPVWGKIAKKLDIEDFNEDSCRNKFNSLMGEYREQADLVQEERRMLKEARRTGSAGDNPDLDDQELGDPWDNVDWKWWETMNELLGK
jgi:hypothetical protein